MGSRPSTSEIHAWLLQGGCGRGCKIFDCGAFIGVAHLMVFHAWAILAVSEEV